MTLPLWQRWLVVAVTILSSFAALNQLFSHTPSTLSNFSLWLFLPLSVVIPLPSLGSSLMQTEDAHQWFLERWFSLSLLIFGVLSLLVEPRIAVTMLLLRQWILFWTWGEGFLEKFADQAFCFLVFLAVTCYVWLALVSQIPLKEGLVFRVLWNFWWQLGVPPNVWLPYGAVVYGLLCFALLWWCLDLWIASLDTREKRWWLLTCVVLFGLQPWVWKGTLQGDLSPLLTLAVFLFLRLEKRALTTPGCISLWIFPTMICIAPGYLPGGILGLLLFAAWRLACFLGLRFQKSEGCERPASSSSAFWQIGLCVIGFVFLIPGKGLETLRALFAAEHWHHSFSLLSRWFGSFLAQELDGGALLKYRCQADTQGWSLCLGGGLPRGWWLMRFLQAGTVFWLLFLMVSSWKQKAHRAWLLWGGAYVTLLVTLAGSFSTFSSKSGLVWAVVLLTSSLSWSSLDRSSRRVTMVSLLVLVLLRFPGQTAVASHSRWGILKQKQQQTLLEKARTFQPSLSKPCVLHDLGPSATESGFVWWKERESLSVSKEPVLRFLGRVFGFLPRHAKLSRRLRGCKNKRLLWLVRYKGAPLQHHWQLKRSGFRAMDESRYFRWSSMLTLRKRFLSRKGEQWLVFEFRKTKKHKNGPVL